jgi:hypothetical protein
VTAVACSKIKTEAPLLGGSPFRTRLPYHLLCLTAQHIHTRRRVRRCCCRCMCQWLTRSAEVGAELEQVLTRPHYMTFLPHTPHGPRGITRGQDTLPCKILLVIVICDWIGDFAVARASLSLSFLSQFVPSLLDLRRVKYEISASVLMILFHNA